MGYECKLLARSVNPDGQSLTTFRVKYPTVVHNQMLRHRMLSRNVKSMRAVGTGSMLQEVRDDPAWMELTEEKKGMVGDALDPQTRVAARYEIEKLQIAALACVQNLMELGVHKQNANRYLLPWAWTHEIVTGMDDAWEDFFRLRCADDAQAEVRTIALMMRNLSRHSPPTPVPWGGLHCPLDPDPWVNAGMAAVVSYDRDRGDSEKMRKLARRCMHNGHWSVFEHCLIAMQGGHDYANFYGWMTHRRYLEDDGSARFYADCYRHDPFSPSGPDVDGVPDAAGVPGVGQVA